MNNRIILINNVWYLVVLSLLIGHVALSIVPTLINYHFHHEPPSHHLRKYTELSRSHDSKPKSTKPCPISRGVNATNQSCRTTSCTDPDPLPLPPRTTVAPLAGVMSTGVGAWVDMEAVTSLWTFTTSCTDPDLLSFPPWTVVMPLARTMNINIEICVNIDAVPILWRFVVSMSVCISPDHNLLSLQLVYNQKK